MTDCRKCGKKLAIPIWKTCNECDNPVLTLSLEEMRQYGSKEYKEKVAEWAREHQERLERVSRLAREPLTKKNLGRIKRKWPEYREFKQCWCCGMELTRKQKDYCSGMCERMYSLYPSQFGLYRR